MAGLWIAYAVYIALEQDSTNRLAHSPTAELTETVGEYSFSLGLNILKAAQAVVWYTAVHIWYSSFRCICSHF
jgi:hypothetical protein